ncbi:hypothetical protein B0H12DRAFT_1096257 [Mycena haematopus]|nr:hypothetical protein B0H12DRAFT_1096257 [Mycena haematopus]
MHHLLIAMGRIHTSEDLPARTWSNIISVGGCSLRTAVEVLGSVKIAAHQAQSSCGW